MIERVTTPGGDYTTPATSVRMHLDHILSRPEFASATQEPSAWERLLARWTRQFGEWLIKMLAKMGVHSSGWELFFWVALVGIIYFVIYLLLQRMRREREILRLPATISSDHVLGSSRWLEAARKNAAQGNYREAIHCAYWAVITRLQETSVLARDREATPREYLRRLQATTRNQPSQQVEALRSLTALFEDSWYGQREAGTDEWMRSAELLGAFGWPAR